VHGDDDDGAGGLDVLVEYSLVDLALLEAEGAEDLRELLIPALACLLETVQGLAKPQDMPGGVLAIAGRVMHVKYFVSLELSIQIGTFNVDLVQLQAEPIGHHNDCTRRGKPGDRGVSIKVIYALNLTEPLHNQPSLVSDDLPRCILLGFEDPLGANDIGSWRRVFKGPGAGGVQGVKLFSDCLLPEWPVGPAFGLDEVAWFEHFRVRGFSRKGHFKSEPTLTQRG
jgi:hypothetical protein